MDAGCPHPTWPTALASSACFCGALLVLLKPPLWSQEELMALLALGKPWDPGTHRTSLEVWVRELTLQVWIHPCQETDHSFQLAEFPVVRVNIRDAVDPGSPGSLVTANPPLFLSHPYLLAYQSLARVRSG